MIKARVTWRIDLRKWEVWEDEPGKLEKHHSFHRTEAAARSAANAQNRINKREAANAAAS